ncbi:TlpA disulfide reductase family protein [Pistricoccus aurantiacus]|nr:TlpA disulfide reductase family protein [Pistricoccus aurantiacus]
MVNFWAVWCKPCRREMPAMNKLNEALEEADFEIVGIHVGPAEPGIDRFLAEVPVDFTILVDEDITLSDWDVLGLPTNLLIDPDGRLIYKAVGERQWDAPEMLDFLKSMMTRTAEGS